MDRAFDFQSPLMGRFGLYGGTFDPIHRGHLYLAHTAMQALNLDGVIFLPSGNPPHKQDRVLTPAEQRLAMLRLALAGEEGLFYSTWEMERPGPNYSYLTAEALTASLPKETQLIFLVGGDSLADMPGWRCPERLLKAMPVAAVYRPGPSEEKLKASVQMLGEDRITLIPCEGMDVSSSAVRAGALQDVPEQVADYIRREGLYGYGS